MSRDRPQKVAACIRAEAVMDEAEEDERLASQPTPCDLVPRGAHYYLAILYSSLTFSLNLTFHAPAPTKRTASNYYTASYSAQR